MVDYNNVSEKVMAERLSDAYRYVNDPKWVPDYSNPVSAPIFWDLVKTRAIPEWEAKYGRKWTKGEKPRELRNTWTADQEARIRARVQPLVDALAQQFELAPEDKERWADWARDMYTIEDGKVTSYAKEDMKGHKPQVWECGSEAEAEKQVGDLIIYKIRDRMRERVDVQDDLNKGLGGPSELR